MKARQLLGIDWDAVAGIIAAVAAIVLHLLHIIDEGVLVTIAVVLIALLFIRDLRRERATEHAYACVDQSLAILRSLEANLAPADAVLVGPSRLRAVSEQFSAQSQGEMLWFNVCLPMFRPQPLFDALLRPAIENPRVTSIQFVLDPRQKALWTSEVLPKANACRGRGRAVHGAHRGAQGPPLHLSRPGSLRARRAPGRARPKLPVHGRGSSVG